MKLQELIQNTVQWSKDRKIIPNSNTQAQLKKSDEEFKEMFDGFYANDKDLFMDGVGDYMVTIINAVATKPKDFITVNKTILDIRGNAFVKESVYGYRKAFSNLLNMQHEIDRSEKCSFLYLEHLFSIAHLSLMSIVSEFNSRNGTTISTEDCYQMAWDSIKDRKGYLNEEGIFIKEV